MVPCDDEKPIDNCVGEFNETLMKDSEATLRLLLKVIVIIGLLHAIVCIKWRKLANLILYYECFTRILVTFIPNFGSYKYTDTEYVTLFTVIFIFVYCDEGKQIITITLTLAWHLYFGLLVAYVKPFTVGIFVFYLAYIFAFITLVTLVGMIITHISTVNEKLHFTNQENVKLLNGMHEGLLILGSKSNEQEDINSIMFCNRTAQKLISNFLGNLKVSP